MTAVTPPMSIIGIGCRVPGASGANDLWRLLVESRSGVGDPPPGRDGAGRGGYLDSITEFDNERFSISDREAALMDPQQRLALEVAVEAIDDAGIGYRLGGSNTAVLFGACGFDHGAVVLGDGGQDPPYAVTGSALSIIANRISYVLDLHGPSVVLDSACSSSLAAVDLAVRLLADDAVPYAVVGGVNLALLPHTSQYLAQGGFLAPDGQCKPFDAAADGYVRGDGATVLVLQRTADAQREGNRSYAEIVGAAVGSDGRSNGLYAPNGRAQQQVIRTAWARAGLDVRSAGYFECHGTGTPVGDAVEIEALATVLDAPRGAVKPYVGSIKSNIGHLEAAAGVTGLAKVALCLHHGTIVPTINFQRENPLLRLSERGLRVPGEVVGWPADSGIPRCAGVSSFGFGGTNAHVVVREVEPGPVREVRPPVLIGLTGRDEDELRDTAAELAGTGERSLSVLAATGRALPQPIRAAIVAEEADDAADALRAVACGSRSPALLGVGERRRGRVLFLFSGQGGQHARMGRELAARYPEYARAVAEAADAVADAGGPRVWTPRHGFADSVGTTETVQPALFVYQVALARLLAAWGIEPDAVAGHSLGEIAAAVIAGALSLDDAAHLVTVRSRALGRLAGQGMMALLEVTPDQARRLIEPLRAEVAVAAVNGPRAVVVSGTTRYMETLLRRARRRQYYVRPVPVDFAAHSPQVRALADEFITALRAPVPRAPRVPVFSTARSGQVIDTAAMDTEYWIDNLCGTVDLDAAVESAAGRGYTSIVEISPHPVLAPAVRDYPELADSVFSAAHRDGEVTALLRTVGALYVRGRDVDWSIQGATPGPAVARRWRRKTFPLLTRTATDPGRERLDDHVVDGVPTVPAAYWIRRLLDSVPGPIRLADFTVHERTDIADLAAVGYRSGSDLRVLLGPVSLASARAEGPASPADILGWMRTVDDHRTSLTTAEELDIDEFYTSLRHRGLDYGPRFRTPAAVRAGSRSAVGLFDSIPLTTAALDGCLQLIAAAGRELLPADGLTVPVAIASVWLSDAPRVLLTEAHAFVREHGPDGLLCDVIALDQHDAPAVALTGVRIAFSGTGVPWQSNPLGHPATHPAPVDTGGVSCSRTAVIADDGTQTADAGAPVTDDATRESRSAASLRGGIAGAGMNPLRGRTAARGRAEYDATVATAPEWADSVLREEQWITVPSAAVTAESTRPTIERAMIVGESALATSITRALDRRVPAQRIARDPGESAALLASTAGEGSTAVVLVWPEPPAPHGRVLPALPGSGGNVADAHGTAPDRKPRREVIGAPAEVHTPVFDAERALRVLQQIVAAETTASLTVVLRDPASVTQNAVAALVRTLQLESGRPVRLIWSDDRGADTVRDLVLGQAGPAEVRVEGARTLTRRFGQLGGARSEVPLCADGTYVVTGGLGALGAAAVRWLLEQGARDVVVLTRRPRPLPPLLDGAEDRVVVVRCDVADRADLANALDDIRACGSTIRGLIHAAGVLQDAEFDRVTGESLASHFEPKVTAAVSLLELTASDPVDFTLLFSSATGLFGSPGQAAYAAANAALDALARGTTGRAVTSIAWGSWDAGLARSAGGAAHLRTAGITPFDAARGMSVLSAILGRPQAVVLALDYTPTDDPGPVAARLREALAPSGSFAADLPRGRAPGSAADNGVSDVADAVSGADVQRIVRATVAGALSREVESVDPEADFATLNLSSLLAIDLRRRLERRLGIRIATAELFDNPSVTALSAALALRMPRQE
ncbi:type I polyketide synthase [Nocardia africana]|uniref:Beta-ketoacyl-acyl-carrier-protein synthase I n=1 Tax=Nocardia africana TaxID=134964 RepID=A0A378WIX4_9NOCA|nr:type I polyketide synthase [Nocardia africana]SUA40872.1 Beta-ketoacyl-acyl-carrier-protein synthase I [Nocardia africana]